MALGKLAKLTLLGASKVAGVVAGTVILTEGTRAIVRRVKRAREEEE
jgi:hypothetical protein